VCVLDKYYKNDLFFYCIIWLAFSIIIFFSIILKLLPKNKDRNKYNKLPVGNLKEYGNKYIDSEGTVWIRRPYIMSLLHNPNENYVFESYDKNIQSSSEAIAEKTFFDKGIQVFMHRSFNYYSPFHNPLLHFYYDVLRG
jgi:hypothetical protein